MFDPGPYEDIFPQFLEIFAVISKSGNLPIPWWDDGTSCSAARAPPSNVMAALTADIEGYSAKAMAVLVHVSSHGGVDPLSSDLSPSKVLISS